MLITYILITHLTLAALVAFGFIYRYYRAFRTRSYPSTGRKLMLGGSVSLVISGVALSMVSKIAITGVCLESLGLITALLVMEFGLQKLGGTLAKQTINKDL